MECTSLIAIQKTRTMIAVMAKRKSTSKNASHVTMSHCVSELYSHLHEELEMRLGEARASRIWLRVTEDRSCSKCSKISDTKSRAEITA